MNYLFRRIGYSAVNPSTAAQTTEIVLLLRRVSYRFRGRWCCVNQSKGELAPKLIAGWSTGSSVPDYWLIISYPIFVDPNHHCVVFACRSSVFTLTWLVDHSCSHVISQSFAILSRDWSIIGHPLTWLADHLLCSSLIGRSFAMLFNDWSIITHGLVLLVAAPVQ